MIDMSRIKATLLHRHIGTQKNVEKLHSWILEMDKMGFILDSLFPSYISIKRFPNLSLISLSMKLDIVSWYKDKMALFI